MISVKKYDESLRPDLEIFIEDLKEYGFDHFNWSSIERMKTDKITYFMAYYEGKIISINGCYHWRDNDWVVYARQITHPKYFRLLKRTRKVWPMWSGSIPVRILTLPTIMYCLENGAENFYYTVNVPKDYNDNSSNWKNGIWPTRHCGLVERQNFGEYDGTFFINGVYQDVYKLEKESFIREIKVLMEEPIEFNNL